MAFDVIFSPPPGIPARIKLEIDAALYTIDMCMYHFSNYALAAALADAVARGVVVRCILDKNSAYDIASMSWQLSRTGILVWTDAFHTHMHEKWAVIDGYRLITGSANWSIQVDGRSAEELYVIDPDPSFITLHTDNWDYHRSHSIPLPR